MAKPSTSKSTATRAPGKAPAKPAKTQTPNAADQTAAAANPAAGAAATPPTSDQGAPAVVATAAPVADPPAAPAPAPAPTATPAPAKGKGSDKLPPAFIVTGPKGGFRRGGIAFGADPVELLPSDWEDTQEDAERLLSILGEPALKVVVRTPDGEEHPAPADFIDQLRAKLAEAAAADA